MIKTTNANAPEWKPITVQSKMPGALAKLDEMAHNMWWTWNTDAYNLYHDIAPDRFKATNHNVIEMLGSLSYEDLTTLSQDAAFLARMDKVYQHFRTYMDEKPDATRPSVAYFCMEYGLYHFLRIYSGGLGILAGDYLKQASDSNVDLTAVGLLYRYGYFTQELAMDGSQIAKYEAQDFERLPINKVMTPEGRQMVLEVPFPGYTLYAQVWRVDVGRVKLYLLDTLEFDEPSTKAAKAVLDALGINGKRVTLVVPDDDIVTYLSFRNIPKVEVIGISEANTRFLIDNAVLVMTTEVAKQLEEVLA